MASNLVVTFNEVDFLTGNVVQRVVDFDQQEVDVLMPGEPEMWVAQSTKVNDHQIAGDSPVTEMEREPVNKITNYNKNTWHKCIAATNWSYLMD